MAELDLAALKRRGVVMGNTPSVPYSEAEHQAVVAALEHIPKLEQERDAMQRRAETAEADWQAAVAALAAIVVEAVNGFAAAREEIERLRTANERNLAAWMNDLAGLRSDLAAAREREGRLGEALEHALDRYECDFPNEENETDCGNCTRCLMRAAVGREDGEPPAEDEVSRLRARLRRAEAIEKAVHDALGMLEQGMPEAAGLALLMAVAETPGELPVEEAPDADR